MSKWTLYDEFLNSKAVYLAKKEILTGRHIRMGYNKLTNFPCFLFWLCCGKKFI